MQRPEGTTKNAERRPITATPAIGRRPEAVAEALQKGFTHKIFPARLQLIPQMHELYEMELASAEAALMSDEELVRNAAYFGRVGT